MGESRRFSECSSKQLSKKARPTQMFVFISANLCCTVLFWKQTEEAEEGKSRSSTVFKLCLKLKGKHLLEAFLLEITISNSFASLYLNAVCFPYNHISTSLIKENYCSLTRQTTQKMTSWGTPQMPENKFLESAE